MQDIPLLRNNVLAYLTHHSKRRLFIKGVIDGFRESADLPCSPACLCRIVEILVEHDVKQDIRHVIVRAYALDIQFEIIECIPQVEFLSAGKIIELLRLFPGNHGLCAFGIPLLLRFRKGLCNA